MLSYLKPKRSLWLKLLPVVILLAISLSLFPSAGRDDAYITYWSAHTLSSFGEMVNYNGDRIEQSSSLLHVVALAVVSRLTTVNVQTVGPVLSILFAVAALVYTQRLASLFVGRVLAVGASVIVATSSYFAYWATGGLEVTLAALVYAALAYHYIGYLDGPHATRPPVSIWLVTAMFLLVRPESVFVAGAAVLAGLSFFLVMTYVNGSRDGYHQSTSRKMLYLFVTVAVISLVIFLFRLSYFGALFPQPVTAKVTGLSLSKMRLGWEYLGASLFKPEFVIVCLAALAGGLYAFYEVVWRDRRLGGMLFLTLLLLAQVAFIVMSGGDWMEGARFVVPVIPLGAVLAVVAVPIIAKKKLIIPVVAVAAALQLPGVVTFARSSSQSLTLWEANSRETKFSLDGFSWFERANDIHLRDIPLVGRLNSVVKQLHEELARPVSIMSGQGGMVPYYVARAHFGDFEFIDRLGLTTDHFTSCSVTRHRPSYPLGKAIPYAYYFENRSEIERSCGIPRPEIIFDLSIHNREASTTRNGYQIIYRRGGQFLAIRANLNHIIEEARGPAGLK